MILTTKPFLPPLKEVQEYLEGIWERNWLTNNGPLVQELERQLCAKLRIDNTLYLTNGTIAIQFALRALKVTGKVITTPFSYVATTSSLVWEGCEPVFVDISEDTFNIDPEKIEDAITPNTSAIVATHCFGNPCDIEASDAIAKQHGLKVIYDAAHCFGTEFKNASVFAYGDISTTSFHATKLFHTVEGGAVFTSDADLARAIAYMRNFGHDGPERFNGLGINGKNSEVHAAMGLTNLKYVDQILRRRKEQFLLYNEFLKELPVKRQRIQSGTVYNYAYYPIVFEREDMTIRAKKLLEEHKVLTRRYFYPSLSSLDYVNRTKMVNAESIGSRILCLPLYHELSDSEIAMIAEVLNKL
jgi:dTDP-4-amino-4,6-dideoxygalactose transaminase